MFPSIMCLLLLCGVVHGAGNATSMPGTRDGAFYCMSCFNCKVFEMTSHSVKCEPSYTRCLRADIKSGEVERKCANEEICQDAAQAAAYTSVECCTTSHCNGGSISRPPIWLLLMLLMMFISIYL